MVLAQTVFAYLNPILGNKLEAELFRISKQANLSYISSYYVRNDIRVSDKHVFKP